MSTLDRLMDVVDKQIDLINTLSKAIIDLQERVKQLENKK